MTAPQRFRKKPVEVEAMKWDGTVAGATPIIDWVLANGWTATYRCPHDMGCPGTTKGHILSIRIDYATMCAHPGWWIIRDGGRFSSLPAGPFGEMYHPVIGASL